MIDYFEWIGDYVEGQLTQQQRAEFEVELARSTELQRAVEDHQVVAGALDYLLEEDIRQVISDLPQPPDDINANQKNWKWLLPLILIAIGSVIGWQLWTHFQKDAPSKEEEIYAMYYTPYIEQNVRGTSQETDDNQSLCDQGHALLNQNDFVGAERKFLIALQDDDDRCIKKSRWYLALIYLRDHQIEKRDSLLQLIVSDESSLYQDKAKQLQSDL